MMCSPFFHEFQVIPSANGFQLVCYTASLFTTEAVCERVDPDWCLAPLNRKRGAVGHDFFSEGSIKVQASWAQTLLIPATGILELALLT